MTKAEKQMLLALNNVNAVLRSQFLNEGERKEFKVWHLNEVMRLVEFYNKEFELTDDAIIDEKISKAVDEIDDRTRLHIS